MARADRNRGHDAEVVGVVIADVAAWTDQNDNSVTSTMDSTYPLALRMDATSTVQAPRSL